MRGGRGFQKQVKAFLVCDKHRKRTWQIGNACGHWAVLSGLGTLWDRMVWVSFVHVACVCSNGHRREFGIYFEDIGSQ